MLCHQLEVSTQLNLTKTISQPLEIGNKVNKSTKKLMVSTCKEILLNAALKTKTDKSI